MEALNLLFPRIRRPADVEDPGDDDDRARARHLRRRAAGTGRAERSGDPAAAHVHDGSDDRDRDAVVHLLGRAVRRGDHVDPVQHSGRGVVGGDHLRRLSDGPAGEGRGGAHRGVHVVVHRLAGRRAADHVSRAAHRVVRIAVRAAGILCRLPADVLLVRRPGARGQAQDADLDGARPAAGRHRHGHRLRPVAHDLRLRPAAARRQLPGRRHRALRHQRDPADHGGAARAARPCGGDQPARGAEGVEGNAALLGDAAALFRHRLLARNHARRRDRRVVHGLQPGQALLEGSRRASARAASKACSRRRRRRTHPEPRRCCRCWRWGFPAPARRRSCSAA